MVTAPEICDALGLAGNNPGIHNEFELTPQNGKTNDP